MKKEKFCTVPAYYFPEKILNKATFYSTNRLNNLICIELEDFIKQSELDQILAPVYQSVLVAKMDKISLYKSINPKTEKFHLYKFVKVNKVKNYEPKN